MKSDVIPANAGIQEATSLAEFSTVRPRRWAPMRRRIVAPGYPLSEYDKLEKS